jgi:glutamate dehydrogenase/leucine dehydrogenase
VQGKRCLVSGSGNVAQYAAEKLLQLGATVLTMSDSTGYIYEPNGFTMEQVQQVGLVGWGGVGVGQQLLCDAVPCVALLSAEHSCTIVGCSAVPNALSEP